MEVNAFNYVSVVKAVREGMEGLASLMSSSGEQNAIDTSAVLYRLRDEFDKALDAMTVNIAPAEKEVVDDDPEEDEFIYGDRYMYLVQDLEAQGMGEEAAAALAYKIIDEERIVDEW